MSKQSAAQAAAAAKKAAAVQAAAAIQPATLSMSEIRAKQREDNKPADITVIDQAALDLAADKQRASLADSSLNTPTVITDVKTDKTRALTDLQKKFRKIGYTVGIVSDHADQVTVKSAGQLFEMQQKNGLIARLVGISASGVIAEYSDSVLAALIAALPVSVRASGNVSKMFSSVKTVYAVDQTTQTGRVNAVSTVITDANGTAELTLTSGLVIKMVRVNAVKMFSSTSKTDARDHWVMSVKFADGTEEVLHTAWVQGNITALNARKSAVSADTLDSWVTAHGLNTVSSADAALTVESSDADSSDESDE